jgi:hypothetical protein
MSTAIHLPLLDRIHVASPCSASWDAMTGDDRTRHCAQCDLDVHNIAELTRDEAEQVLAKLAEGRVCARFFRRTDGTILTKDCPVGLAAIRRRVLTATSRVAAAIGLAVLAGAAARAAQDKSWGNWGWSIRLSNSPPVRWATCKVQSQVARWRSTSGVVPVEYMGDAAIRLPPEPKPPVKASIPNFPFGPHDWEFRE